MLTYRWDSHWPSGKRVVAIDVDTKRVAETNAGTMPFRDRGADELLPRVLKAGTFTCTTEPAVVSQADTVISVIGTPIDEYLNPRFEIMQDFVEQYEAYLRVGQLLGYVAQLLFYLCKGQWRHGNLPSYVKVRCGRKVSAFLCHCHARSPEQHYCAVVTAYWKGAHHQQ